MINLGGGQFRACVLGGKTGNISIFENITFMISGKAKMKQIHWVQTFPLSDLTQVCLLGGLITKVQISTL